MSLLNKVLLYASCLKRISDGHTVRVRDYTGKIFNFADFKTYDYTLIISHLRILPLEFAGLEALFPF